MSGIDGLGWPNPEDESQGAGEKNAFARRSEAGSPVYVPLHEADVPLIPAGTWARKCRGKQLDGGREILTGQIEDDQGLLIRISRPIEGKEARSLLEFGLSWDAAKALNEVLCWQIKERESAGHLATAPDEPENQQ